MDTDIIEMNEKSEGSLNISEKSKKETPKTYVFYCVMTLSVMLFALAFAASELFSLFFSEGYLGGMFMSKLFGADLTSDMSFKEILLSQSFGDLSYWKEKEDKPDSGENEDFSDVPSENVTVIPDTYNPEIPKDPSSNEKNENIYDYDPSGIPLGMSGIIPLDLSLSQYGTGYIYNQSSFAPDVEKLKAIDVSTNMAGIYPKGFPVVLIVHTHGTEAFSPSDVGYYDPSKEIARSDDKDFNVVSLGAAIAEILNENGIPTVHCDIMHDIDGYTGSYDRSADTIKKYLKKYPSIQYVIDVHRDAVVRSSGELVKPVVATEKGTAAQIMCVVGTGGNSEYCSNWERNLALAQELRSSLNSEYENFCRPSCLRDSSYNQQFSAYSMLLEIGAAGNTHEEALLSAKTAAKALAAVIKGE